MPESSAIVSKALDQAIAECIAIDKTIVGVERKTLEQFIELGKALWKVKGQCAHGQWLKAMEKTGIPKRRAQQAMQCAKCAPVRISKCSSIRDLLQELPTPTDEIDEVGDRQPGDEEGEETTENSTPTPTVFCRPCRIAGPKKNCKACAELRGEKPKTTTTISSNRGSSNGRETFDWKRWESPFGSVVRNVDILVKAFPKEKKCSEVEKIEDACEVIAQNMKSLKTRLTKSKE